MLAALEGTEPNLQYTRQPYDSFTGLHDRIDSSVFIQAEVDNDGEVPGVRVVSRDAQPA